MPNISAADVLFFVRSVSQEPHLSYSEFMELLCTPEEMRAVAEGGIATPLGGTASAANGSAEPSDTRASSARTGSAIASSASPSAFSKAQLSARVVPRGEEELQRLLESRVAEERRVEAELETAEREQMEAARRHLEEQMLDADFSWLRQSKQARWRSALMSHSTPLGPTRPPLDPLDPLYPLPPSSYCHRGDDRGSHLLFNVLRSLMHLSL